MASTLPAPTFRDPGGTVTVGPEDVVRSIHHSHAADMLAFLETPLCRRLVAEGRLVSSQILSPATTTGPLLLIHPRIAFASFSWEWPPALWLAAAELTLTLCADLVKEGWILKDGTPLNVLFQGANPVFVDVLSIQRLDERRPLWFAYGQFVRTFLLPMIAHSQLGWPLHSVLMRRDGFEPEEIFTALPWPRRLTRPALTAITLPILLESIFGSARSRTRTKTSPTTGPSDTVHPAEISSSAILLKDDPELTRHIIGRSLTRLRKAMHTAMPPPRRSTWTGYAENAPHYSGEDHLAKRRFVTEMLTRCRPHRVLDVGCNTGVYSRLAAAAGAEVVAIDTDLQAVDRLCCELRGDGSSILPLCVDLAHPTPATGWNNRETLSFLDRSTGHFDTVLMLAVLHHLLLTSQIPLDDIAALCRRITTHHLIVEWIPPTDPMFREVLRGREALYTHITESAFRQAFSLHFESLNEITLHNGRVIQHLTRR